MKGRLLPEAHEDEPAFRPDMLEDHPAGRPNEVVVPGSPHFSSLPETFTPQLVDGLLSRLVARRPTAVASESISGKMG